MPPRLQPLGDQAVLAHCADEAAARAFAARVRAAGFVWLLDVVQAYTSVAVFHDPGQTDCFAVERALAPLDVDAETTCAPGRRHVIPCCYELGPDLARVAAHTGLASDAVIRLHAEARYVVCAIGFCPGFPYLGYLPAPLAGVPRLETPRLRVEAGSVGMTGRQTGIYTEARPGGWNLVGRTPLTLVDVADGYFPLRTGDEVQFQRVDTQEFRRLEGERLEVR